jgi:hypothetical protein
MQAYGWQWVGSRCGLAIDQVGVYSVRMRNSHTHRIAVLHVCTRLVRATYEVTIVQATHIDTPIADYHPHPPHGSAHPALPHASSATANPRRPAVAQGLNDVEAPSATELGLDPNELESESGEPVLGAGAVPGAAGIAESTSTALPATSAADAIEPVPYRIENFSLLTLRVHQHGTGTGGDKLAQRVLPYHSSPYAWDEPMDTDKRLVIEALVNLSETGQTLRRPIGDYNLDKIARYPVVTLPEDRVHRQPAKQVHVNVYADGRVRVIRITDITLTSDDVLRPIVSPALSGARRTAAGSGTIAQLFALPWDLDLDLAGIGLSFINSQLSRQELLYLSLSGLHLALSNTPDLLSIEAAIDAIQVRLNAVGASLSFVLIYCCFAVPCSSTTKWRTLRSRLFCVPVILP